MTKGVEKPEIPLFYAQRGGGATDETKRKDVAAMKKALNVLDFSEEVAETAALIFQDLRRKNQLIGNNDIYIAATAMVHELALLTLNRKDFERIEKLNLL
jgi:tRNA(fMet)-specific endonuclease VapC